MHFALLQEISLLSLASFCQSRAYDRRSWHGGGGEGLGAAAPEIFQVPIFGQIPANLRARTPDFRGSNILICLSVVLVNSNV